MCFLEKEDRSRGKRLIKDGAISSGSGKAHTLLRVALGQPDASPVLMPLCKRCGVSITARDGSLKSGWAPLLDFFFLSFLGK